MICSHCQVGAGWNSSWRVTGDEGLLSGASRYHAWCTGCPCQHTIGASSALVVPHVA